MKSKLIIVLMCLITLFASCVTAPVAYARQVEGTTTKSSSSNKPKESCEGFLGDPKVKATPAYYLTFVLKLMRYAAVLFVLIFSTIDFFKATVTQDKDALKKATVTSAKRLIIAIVIFFLPTLINFIMKIIGGYNTCGIN